MILTQHSCKRRGWVVLLICLTLILAACGSGNANDTVSDSTQAAEVEQQPTDTPQPEPPATPESAEAASDAANVEEAAVAPRVFFQQPTNHAVLPTTATVIMGFEGLTVEPSGEITDGAGHMHILIDADFVPAGEVIPNDDLHLHFGDGAIETALSLTPGTYTLRLQFANGAHIALEGDEYRDEIIVSVKEDAPAQAVRFAQPSNGATVPPAFDVIMAATGLIVEPAGDVREHAGHMHILINTDFIAAGEVIPNDEQHLHFGNGQLEVPLELVPGEHVLRLQMANGAHIAVDGEQYRDEIRVTVVEDAPAPQVMFVSPEDGAAVDGTFGVKMAAVGLTVEPSGMVVRADGGHFHILIDTDFIPAGEVIPNDEQHRHFGGGQTAIELSLTPGEHTLRLQMANGAHVALDGDQYRDEITIVVGEGSASSTAPTADAAASEEEASNDADAADTGQADDDTSVDGARAPQALWASLSCASCHMIDQVQSADNRGPVGPHMGNFHERAGARVEGQSAEEYTHSSIVDPSAFVVETYIDNIMPKNFAEKMNEEELNALVAWLLDPEREE